MKKKISTVLITLFLIFAATAAHADLITQEFTGTITFSDESNPFGVDADDIFTWEATYDPAYMSSTNTITIGESADMHLSVTIGSRTFVETEDVFYGPGNFGAPILTFDAEDEDKINGVSLLVDDVVNGYRFRSNGVGSAFDIYSIGSDGFSDDVHLASGTFGFSPVPVPGAVWLLGGGLLGLVGLRRRRSA
jgi:hypothetical protein